MTKIRNREEVINTQLAVFISKLGVSADAETIHVHGAHRPDVLFQLRGLRVVIEGKFADVHNAKQVVLGDARKRVASGLAHIATAVIYPVILRETSTAKILGALRTTELQYRIVAETHETDWFEGTPESLMDALRRAQEALTKDDIVEKTAKELSDRLEGVSQLWMGQAGACDRLSKILGITIPKGENGEKAEERRETAAKVSALVLANAFIFEEQLAVTDGRISSLGVLEKEKKLVDATADHWRWIWKEINYVPIFQLGERILAELPSSQNTTVAVKALLSEAKNICNAQAALRHDLMGRIYHRLLYYAKYLGTYYTAVPSATLLLKLALAADWKQDFGDPKTLAAFKTADLACGTGTLLMAAAQAFADNYIRARAGSGRSLEEKDLSTLHKTLMENMLHGYDILPTAVHLTASTLALLAPEVAFRKMNLYVMPMGIDHGDARLGSLDFLTGSEIKTQMALDYSQLETVRKGAAHSHISNATVPKIDLCVMNPPFVRNVYGNLIFGSLPEERVVLKRELNKLAKKMGVSATAGLGAVFVPLADRHLKPGGRMAFVLPVTLATGEAWSAIRRLIADNYHLETVIVSHDSERPNFSENTDLSELLFIARKLRSGEKAGVAQFINLWRNPRSIIEAIDVAHRIENTKGIVSINDVGVTTIRGPSGKIGEIVSCPAAKGVENWTGALFAQTDLLRIYYSLLATKKLMIPGKAEGFQLALCSLGELGELGYDVRDIFDAFAVNKSGDEWSPYPAFWDHDAQKVRTIAQKANARLIARTSAIPGRKLKSAAAVWSKSGNILLVSRLRTNTHRVLATAFDECVLGNTWWAFAANNLSEEQRKALLLWLNSSLSLLMYFGRRAITEGAWMQMKKPAWTNIPVLDVRALTPKALKALATAYDALSGEEFAPLAQLNKDETRQQIDDALSKVLEIPSLRPIEEMLAREPGLSAIDINPRAADRELDEEVEVDLDQSALF